MTLPTTPPSTVADDDSDMFGPPRTSPLRHTRPRVPMISAKLRLREERKRILQLCAHKLERIKDTEANLRRSVCINNTYSRLTDEVRREKQSRFLANQPKPNNNASNNQYFGHPHHINTSYLAVDLQRRHDKRHQTPTQHKYQRCSSSVDSDLELLDRELNALDASMPLVDPEITQGAEQLEKAISRKRSRSNDENDRLVREALSHIYLPSPRLLSAIDECPLLTEKRYKMSSTPSAADMDLTHFDLNNLDHNQNKKEFDVILDSLRLGNDSCGQAALLSESSSFHNLVVASLET